MVEIKFVRMIYNQVSNDLRTVEKTPRKRIPKGYVIIADSIDAKDASAFLRRMHRKYVHGRKTGRFPTLEIIVIELVLFIKLKNYRRKLV